jgi:uncharacterized membrane protein
MTAFYTLTLLLHLVAFAMWIGGIVFFLVVLGPAVHELEPAVAIRTLNRGRLGLETISWIAIGLLLITGIAHLALRDSGAATGGSYLVLLGIKLVIFFAMVGHHGLQVFKYGPRIAAQTAAANAAVTVWPDQLLADWRRWFLLIKINATLGPLAVLLGLALTRG